MTCVIAYDIGTSTISAVAVINGQEHRITTPDGNVFKSVFCRDSSGEIQMGIQALTVSSPHPELLVQNPKKWFVEQPFEVIGSTGLSPADCFGHALKTMEALACQQHTELAKAKEDGTLVRIVTVPASYGEVEKKNLFEIGKTWEVPISGFTTESSAPIFKVQHNHPDHFSDGEKVAVIDDGGGTLDISVFEIRDNLPNEVLTGRGNGNCGGMLASGLMYQWFCLEHGFHDILDFYDDADGRFIFSDSQHDASIIRFAHAAISSIDQLKIEFTEKEEATTYCEGPDRNLIEIQQDKLKHLSVIEPFLARLEESVRTALDSSELEWDHIDKVILVGGPTLTPTLKERIQVATGKTEDQIYHDRDPHYAIASGAALSAKVADSVTKAVADPIGILVEDKGTGQEVVKLLLDRDTQIPAGGLTLEDCDQYVSSSTGGISDIYLEIFSLNKGVQVPKANGRRPTVPVHCCTRLQSKSLQFSLPAGEHVVRTTLRNDGRMTQLSLCPDLADVEPQTWFLHDDSDLPAENSTSELMLTMVADASGSMSGEKLNQVKAGILAQLENWLEANARIGIVTFGKLTERILDFSADRNEISDKVESMSSGGGTPMPKGIDEALALIKEFPQARHIVIFWSDGQPNDLIKSQEKAKQLREAADMVIAIGIGQTANEDLLKNYVASSPDFYYFAEAPALSSVFQTITRLYINPDQGEQDEELF